MGLGYPAQFLGGIYSGSNRNISDFFLISPFASPSRREPMAQQWDVLLEVI